MRALRQRQDVLLLLGLVGGCVQQANVSQRPAGSSFVTSIDFGPSPSTGYLSVADLLSQRIAGLELLRGPNGRESLRFRAGTEVLFVIDGVATPGDAGTVLAALSPSDIQHVTVVKDADAAAAFGSRGRDGVIILTTRHSP